MAELKILPADGAKSCCAPETQRTCCAPEAKAGCCDAGNDSAACGCDAAGEPRKTMAPE